MERSSGLGKDLGVGGNGSTWEGLLLAFLHPRSDAHSPADPRPDLVALQHLRRQGKGCLLLLGIFSPLHFQAGQAQQGGGSDCCWTAHPSPQQRGRALPIPVLLRRPTTGLLAVVVALLALLLLLLPLLFCTLVDVVAPTGRLATQTVWVLPTVLARRRGQGQGQVCVVGRDTLSSA